MFHQVLNNDNNFIIILALLRFLTSATLKQVFQRALFNVTSCLFCEYVFLFEHLLRSQRLQLSVSGPMLSFLDLNGS